MARPSVVLALAALASLHGLARAEDAPPTPAPEKPAPPKGPPPPPKPKAPTYVGIRWENDFAEGLRRSVAEGRPVLVCVNAQDDQEGGNRTLYTSVYPTKAMGDASREWVCVVANGGSHETKTVDGAEVCGRYLSGTCQAHLDALTFVTKQFGSSFISPCHAVIDPDGVIVYHGEYMQSVLSEVDLDRWLIRLSPRLALRRVWTVREAKTDALGKMKTEELEAAAKAWVDSKDPWAAASIVAMADQETDATRKIALTRALSDTGLDDAALFFDSVDEFGGDPDRNRALAEAWIAKPHGAWDLYVWGLGRALLHEHDVDVAKRWITALETSGDGSLVSRDAPAVRESQTRAAEALALARGVPYLPGFEKAAAAAGWPAFRVERAKAKAGKRTPPNLDALDKASRDEKRRAWMAATPDECKAAKAKALAALKDPIDEIRVAAAIALRRAGDSSGAAILRQAFSDPVEEPDVRAALTELAGEDRGESADAWDDVIRGGGK